MKNIMDYIPLTKKTLDETNNDTIECSFKGTDKCQIHSEQGCTNCPVFKAILAHLNAFETIYLEKEDEEMTK